MVTSIKKAITYENYLKLPETKQRYEIVDGEFFLTPAPTIRHQLVIENLYRALNDYVSRRKLGVLLLCPHDIVVRRAPKLSTRQPDLTYVSKERNQILGTRIEGGGPDLVIEIISSEDARKRMDRKLEDYAAIGVRECWIVATQAKTVEVLRPGSEQSKIIARYAPHDIVSSVVLAGFKLPVRKIFP